jgi:hypothetical protein
MSADGLDQATSSTARFQEPIKLFNLFKYANPEYLP